MIRDYLFGFLQDVAKNILAALLLIYILVAVYDQKLVTVYQAWKEVMRIMNGCVQ